MHPTHVPLPDQDRVCELSCSSYHALVIGYSGKLYTFGRNAEGQLGNGGHIKKIKPRAIKLPGDAKAKIVAAGKVHSFCISQTGELFAWGLNSCMTFEFDIIVDHRLGLASNKRSVKRPKQVLLPNGEKAAKLFCAFSEVQTFCITEAGTLIGWGLNQGHLISEEPITSLTPTVIELSYFEDFETKPHQIDRLLFSTEDVAYCLTATGDVFAWGSSRQLTRPAQIVPFKVFVNPYHLSKNHLLDRVRTDVSNSLIDQETFEHFKTKLNYYLRHHLTHIDDYTTTWGGTFLLDAFRHANKVAINFLLKEGASPNCKDESGKSILHLIAYSDQVVTDILEEHSHLICQQAQLIDERDAMGCTALMYATSRGNISTMTWLLQHGADPTAVDKQGNNLMHFAIRNAHAACLELLVQMKVNINHINSAGKTPLDCVNKSIFARTNDFTNTPTPLMLSYVQKNQTYAESLVTHGAKTTQEILGAQKTCEHIFHI